MQLPQYVRIGQLGKPYGRDGELKLFVEEAFLEDIAQARALFVEYDGHPAPFFVEQLRESNELLIKFDEFHNPEDASVLTNMPVFLMQSDLSAGRVVSVGGTGLQYAHLEGYTLTDQTLGTIGPVLRVEEFPQQEIAFVEYMGAERMVPLHPQLIVRIDQQYKEVEVKLPEGLLDI